MLIRYMHPSAGNRVGGPVRHRRRKFSPAEVERRRKFFEAYNAAYAALQADPEAWAAELAERRVWEGTLMDGLEDLG